jgi:transcriptional regulator with XRE-family HTH domain
LSNEASFFSARLRQAAEAKGLKQQALADLMGVNLDRVKSIYSGKVKKLEASEVMALEKNLHLRPDFLLRNEGPMFKTEAEQKVMDSLRRSVLTHKVQDIPEWVKRLAQEWSFAIERSDAARLVELATLSSNVKVEDGTPTYIVSGKPDADLLRAVISAAFAELEKQHKTLSADKLSELVVVLYESSQADRTVNQATVKSLVKLAS